MFADGHLLKITRCFENLVILLTWIRIDKILGIRIPIRIQSLRIHITGIYRRSYWELYCCRAVVACIHPVVDHQVTTKLIIFINWLTDGINCFLYIVSLSNLMLDWTFNWSMDEKEVLSCHIEWIMNSRCN